MKWPLSSSPGRDRDPPCAGEKLAGDQALDTHHVLRRALGDDVAAVLAAGPPCRRDGQPSASSARHARRLEDGVAERLEPLGRPDQLVVVALVQADRGLVEDVEDADELGADLRRQPQPLRLAARERLRGAVELEVADADVVEEGQPLADFLDDPVADQLLGRVFDSSRNASARVADIRVKLWIDSPPTVTASTSGFRRAPAARRAGPGSCTPRSAPAAGPSRFPCSGARAGDDPLERHRVGAAPVVRLRYWT